MEDSIRLWIALAPPQMEELRTHHRIQPDIHTSRIDLSATHAPIGRATDIHWCCGDLVGLYDASAALPSVVGRELSKDECYPPLSSNRDYTPGLSKEKWLRGIDANMQLNCLSMWIDTHCKSLSMLISRL